MSEHHPMSQLCRRVTNATTPIIFDLNPKVTLDHVADELDRLHAENANLDIYLDGARGVIAECEVHIAELEAENERLRLIERAAREYMSDLDGEDTAAPWKLAAALAAQPEPGGEG